VYDAPRILPNCAMLLLNGSCVLAPATALELGGGEIAKHETDSKTNVFIFQKKKKKKRGDQWRNDGTTMLDWIVSLNLK
jgi:hypothetical protein